MCIRDRIARLLLFLEVRSSRVFADGFQSDFIAARGEKIWKGICPIPSITGFVLLIYSYGEARGTVGLHLCRAGRA